MAETNAKSASQLLLSLPEEVRSVVLAQIPSREVPLSKYLDALFQNINSLPENDLTEEIKSLETVLSWSATTNNMFLDSFPSSQPAGALETPRTTHGRNATQIEEQIMFTLRAMQQKLITLVRAHIQTTHLCAQ